LSRLTFHVVRTSLNDTIDELQTKIAIVTGIHYDRIVIILRHESTNNTIRCEYFNMEWRRGKKLKDCSKIEHGWTLFVEDADPKQNFDTFNWKKEFSAEVERITILLNDPRSDPDASYYNIKMSL
jgi:hypothetical protein